MDTVTAQILNGYRLRTDATKARLLAAAEVVFAREGFESAQLATIAKQAGRTKGSIYAHYRSKDDLFLALYEDRTRQRITDLADLLKNCQTREQAIDRFKAFLIDIAKAKNWPLLTLEFKLYSVRHPESRDRWKRSYEMVRSFGTELLDGYLFRGLPSAERAELDFQMLAISPLISSLTLETYFEPRLHSEGELSRIIDLTLSALLQTGR